MEYLGKAILLFVKIWIAALLIGAAAGFLAVQADEPEGGFCHPGELAICPAKCLFIKSYRWPENGPAKSCEETESDE